MPRIWLVLPWLLLGLPGCAVLVVPAAVTTQELARDRKGDFERGRSALVGRSLHEDCDFPRKPGELDLCGKHVATRVAQGGKEYIFEVVPPNCSYSLLVDAGQQIVGWSYVSEPSECWKFFLAPP